MLRNKIIRLKTAGVIALPLLGMMFGFFTGAKVAQSIYAPQVAVVKVIHYPQPSPTIHKCEEPENPDEMRTHCHEPLELRSGIKNIEWRDSVDKKIQQSMKQTLSISTEPAEPLPPRNCKVSPPQALRCFGG